MNPKELNTGIFPTWCPGCVFPGTIIHTNPDVKPIEVLKNGDKVLGSDGRYHKITKTMVHVHKGKMYRIKSKHFGETILTDEHPVFISKRQNKHQKNKQFELVWERADSLKQGDYLAYPILQEIVAVMEVPLPKKFEKDGKSFKIPETITITEDFMRLAGYYLSEGWIHKRSSLKNKLDSELCFTFNKKEMDFIEDIQEIVHVIFGEFVSTSIKKRDEKNTVDAIINSARIARFFHELFGAGAENKKVPSFMMLLPLDFQKELLKGLWRGDGWIDKKRPRAHYKTISQTLAEQIKLLLLRQGIIPTVIKEEAHENHRTSWAIYVLGNRDFPKLLSIFGLQLNVSNSRIGGSSALTDKYALIPVSKIESFDYDGLVYNLEVEDVQSYVSGNAILHNCGDISIFASIKNAMAKMDMPIESYFFTYGVGCHGHMGNFLRSYGFEGLHGRPLPVAEGAKLANKDLNVIVISGDGDAYGEGISHFMAVTRRNMDMTLIVHDNMVYGLTTGQVTPTSMKGFKSKSTPEGTIEQPLNPIALAITQGATFVARAFAGDPAHLSNLIVEAVKHKGFALIDVMQPCVTFNHLNTYQWYRERIYKLEENSHDFRNKLEAIRKAMEQDKLPIGIFYKEESKTYEEQVATQTALVKEPIETDVTQLIESFK